MGRFNYQSFEELPIDCEVFARISDNVLESEDWPVSLLIIRDGIVVKQNDICNGCYDLGDMEGWTIEDLCDWSQFDSTGSHPENYHELHLTVGGEEL